MARRFLCRQWHRCVQGLEASADGAPTPPVAEAAEAPGREISAAHAAAAAAGAAMAEAVARSEAAPAAAARAVAADDGALAAERERNRMLTQRLGESQTALSDLRSQLAEAKRAGAAHSNNGKARSRRLQPLCWCMEFIPLYPTTQCFSDRVLRCVTDSPHARPSAKQYAKTPRSQLVSG